MFPKETPRQISALANSVRVLYTYHIHLCTRHTFFSEKNEHQKGGAPRAWVWWNKQTPLHTKMCVCRVRLVHGCFFFSSGYSTAQPDPTSARNDKIACCSSKKRKVAFLFHRKESGVIRERVRRQNGSSGTAVSPEGDRTNKMVPRAHLSCQQLRQEHVPVLTGFFLQLGKAARCETSS